MSIVYVSSLPSNIYSTFSNGRRDFIWQGTLKVHMNQKDTMEQAKVYSLALKVEPQYKSMLVLWHFLLFSPF